MRRSAGVLIALAAFFCGSAYPSAIRIRITEPPGNAISHASARLFRAGRAASEAEIESDGNGGFAFERLGAGDYRVEITKAGYLKSIITVHLGNQGAVLPIELIRAGAVSGSVIDGSGKPIAGALVVATRWGEALARPGVSNSRMFGAISDGTGGYRISGVVPGKYMLMLRHGTGPASTLAGAMLFPRNESPEPVLVGSGQERENIDFRIFPQQPSAIRGRIEQTSPGERYLVNLSLCGYAGTTVATRGADEAGRFEFPGLAGGTWCVTAAGGPLGRRLVARKEVEAQPNGGTEAVLEAMPAQDLRITLQGPAGFKPSPDCISEVSFDLLPGEDWPGDFARRLRLRPGQTAFATSVAPGKLLVLPQDSDQSCYELKSAPVAVSAGTPLPAVVLNVTQRSELSARIGSSDVTLTMADSDLAAGFQRVYAANPDGGQFRLAGLRSGAYRLTLADNGRQWAFDLNLAPGKTDADFSGWAAKAPGR